jgi:hypothetical protein
MQTRPTTVPPHIPPNASPDLAAFMTTQANMTNARAQIHNQLIQQVTASSQSVTLAQVNQMEQQAMQQFRQQHATDLQAQTQHMQSIAAAAGQKPLPLPPEPQIPANASPQMATYLSAQYQLIKSRVQMLNQYASADPATRQAAMVQWSQQNAQLIQQVRTQAQNISQAEQPN